MIKSRVAAGTATGCAFPGCHNLFKRVTCRKFCSPECGAQIRVAERNRLCEVEGCERFADRKTYCGAHYRRLRDGRSLDEPIMLKFPGGRPCSVANCPNKATAKGLCPTHRRRQKVGVSLTAPVRNFNPAKPYMDPLGYVRIHIPGRGRVMEHRHVMEQSLGRPLRAFENVHHMNGVRHDNRPENLELWVTPQPPGQRVEDLVSWVVEFYAAEITEALGS